MFRQPAGMPENHPYNLTIGALAYSIDSDIPGQRIPIRDVVTQIAEMDIDPELRNGHIAGLLAARLSLDYLDTQPYAVHEKTLGIGTLAMLGCYIIERTPLTAAEMDYAEAYQRVILHTRILDDFEPEPVYAIRAHSSIISRMQEHIRFNRYGYQGGRAEFSRIHADIVTGYKDFIGATHPTGGHIAAYRDDATIAPLLERFVRSRRSLLGYTPELAAQEQGLWQYARTHYARYILPHVALYPPQPKENGIP